MNRNLQKDTIKYIGHGIFLAYRIYTPIVEVFELPELKLV